MDLSKPSGPHLDARTWPGVLAGYHRPSTARSILEIAVTVIPFVALWVLIAVAVVNGHWWALVLTVPAAGFLVRLFMLQHDCGHGALFPRRRANDWAGRVLGVLTFTPYDYWRRTHAVHHASAGNLDKRGVSDVHTLTVHEYMALSRWGRARYWLYRHPVVMFGVGPAWLFLCQHRLPIGLMRAGALPWVSVLATNLAIALLTAGLIWWLGLFTLLVIQLPITLMAATAGIWLFFVQHQFEDTHWSEGRDWSFPHAALHGSTHLDLPPVLRWFTANIGVHHVHHLSSRVPFYRLPDVLRDHPELREVGRITLLQSLQSVKLTLWDEHSQRLISFREARSVG
ncbi:Beta-carotene ketolase [Rubellimicrobium mesophilum DSM 19309]|uniref:Beta-carotene ketolase n=2 Tax=Rubellimicrobium TaxID=295418 RepID=A0A017HNF7_9RHOB|nr:fatty acid desaturase [Rubellimicrobium mesophilum]EYD75319.1 Beta-carotene ketolase [Rubellimicrobium mesophilum DSM 19309]